MAEEFQAQLRDAGGSVAEPDAAVAWRAFAAFARVAVELGDVAPAMTEDFLMCDHSHGEGLPAVLSLERKIGLADANGDYVDSRHFECSLVYDDHPDIDSLPTDSVCASSPPECPLAAVSSFVEKVEASDIFRVLVREQRPTRMDLSW